MNKKGIFAFSSIPAEKKSKEHKDKVTIIDVYGICTYG